MILRAGLVALAASLPLTALAQDVVPGPASADDCAVMAEVGKGALKWQGDPQSTPMSAKSFGVDCDWKAFGTAGPRSAPPDPGPYYEGLRLFFARPVYDSDGATLDYSITGSASAKSYFLAGYRCRVDRRDDRWQFGACQRRFIT